MRYIIFLFIFTCFCNAQYVKVDYDSSILDDRDEYGAYGFNNAQLISSSTESIYVMRRRDTVFFNKIFGEAHQVSDTVTRKLYKDLVKKESYFRFSLGGRRFVKDDRYSINWTITNVDKKILGYDTKEAIGTFRGRNYHVYFCPSLPFQNGPFKFDGLPGLILQVLSDDGSVKITAKNVKVSENERIINPFKNESYITWEEFKKEYKKTFDKFNSYNPENDSKTVISNREVEYYVDNK